jgi:methylase of polypeptide subunit release factors
VHPSDTPVAGAGDLRRLRDDLAPYTAAAVEERLGPVATAALAREQRVPAVLALDPLPGQDPVAVLTALFRLGLPVPRRALDTALPTLGAGGAERCGLVAAAGHDPQDAVRPLVDLRPHAALDALGPAHWWIASDLPAGNTPGPLRHDHVLGTGGASAALAGSTVRTRVGRALDVGTGSGVQALHLTRHAGRVTATDLSPRALAYARFTLALNGDPDVDLRRGDLLAPVAGERFDLVVANPPFVITPRAATTPVYTYRDGGRSGDGVMAELVRGAADALTPGGVAQVLGNWEHHRGTAWQDRITHWLDGTDLDAWVVQREVLDPAEYAEMWLRDSSPSGSSIQDGDLYAAWLRDLAARGVEAVGLGLITLRRPATARPPRRRLEEVRTPVGRPLGAHLERCLAASDWLADHDDEQLLRAHLEVAADVTEERHHLPGEEDPEVILLRQGDGFGRTVRAGTVLAGFVGACDGELAVGAVAGALAHLLEVPVEGVLAELLPAVRDLVGDGLLLPPAERSG